MKYILNANVCVIIRRSDRTIREKCDSSFMFFWGCFSHRVPVCFCKEPVGAGPCACPAIIGQRQGVAPTILCLSSCSSCFSLRALRGRSFWFRASDFGFITIIVPSIENLQAASAPPAAISETPRSPLCGFPPSPGSRSRKRRNPRPSPPCLCHTAFSLSPDNFYRRR